MKANTILKAFLVIAVIAIIGYIVYNSNKAAEIKEEANPVLDSLINVNNTLQADIDQLKKDTMDLGEQLKKLKNEQINQRGQQNNQSQKTSQTSGQTANKTAIEKANEKALKYLNDNTEWSIVLMKRAAGEEYYKETECYKYLEVLLTADVSDSVIKSFDSTKIESDIWKKLHKKLLSSDPVKIINALNKKAVNSAYSASAGKKVRLDGTISIRKLNNYLVEP